MMAAKSLSEETTISNACACLGVPRSSFYRVQSKKSSCNSLDVRPPLALSEEEKSAVIELMHSERFADKTPYEIYGTMLDEGQYLCSIRTMYRYLSELGESNERRRNHKKRDDIKPELLAIQPNEVWSWDITKLKGPQKWTYFYLYVIIDIYSRYVVGWVVSESERSDLASDFIEQTCSKQNIKPEQLTLHADRGASMKSKLVANLLGDLGVTKTHNRPYVSDDNPYSESQFKTLKYCPEFPKQFGSLQDARAFCRTFFMWYNNEHRHTGIALFTPQAVHYGQDKELLKTRNLALTTAFTANPERFKNNKPKAAEVPDAVYINKPKSGEEQLEVAAH